jgi:hypothetical protein
MNLKVQPARNPGGEMHEDGLQAVVAPRTARRANPQPPEGQRSIVKHDQNALVGDFVEIGHGPYGHAAQVHESRRFKQPCALRARDIPLETPLPVERLGGQRIEREPTDVVPRAGVAGPGISQTGDQP